jgi:hypothetical protein
MEKYLRIPKENLPSGNTSTTLHTIKILKVTRTDLSYSLTIDILTMDIGVFAKTDIESCFAVFSRSPNLVQRTSPVVLSIKVARMVADNIAGVGTTPGTTPLNTAPAISLVIKPEDF